MRFVAQLDFSLADFDDQVEFFFLTDERPASIQYANARQFPG
jgi:hypothetical protein